MPGDEEMKYRKKPIIVEAEQWFPGNEIECVLKRTEYILGFPYFFYFIRTLEGEMEVKEKDWIITGVNGEKYPCKPDVFEKTYEAVE